MKRIISAGLCTAFILSLAGCARQDTTPSLTAADTTDTQMGRWVESRVDLGGEPLISYPTQLADGTVASVDSAVAAELEAAVSVEAAEEPQAAKEAAMQPAIATAAMFFIFIGDFPSI